MYVDDTIPGKGTKELQMNGTEQNENINILQFPRRITRETTGKYFYLSFTGTGYAGPSITSCTRGPIGNSISDMMRFTKRLVKQNWSRGRSVRFIQRVKRKFISGTIETDILWRDLSAPIQCRIRFLFLFSCCKLAERDYVLFQSHGFLFCIKLVFIQNYTYFTYCATPCRGRFCNIAAGPFFLNELKIFVLFLFQMQFFLQNCACILSST